jgi:EAL domain-containing protein (putative c-di-GMP-specific phosphodiesterase class I)
LHYAIETPLEHEGATLAVGASIGIAVAPQHGRAVGTLLRHADLAMYQAKRSGVGHVVFEPGANERDAAAESLTEDLKEALDRGEIVLHYQPTVALDSLEVGGVEALLRWEHPEEGTLPADRFIPLADRARVRHRLYDFALCEAVRQAGEWRRAGLELSVGINLDARTLIDRDLPRRLEWLLAEHGVDAQQLVAEISEAELLSDVERVTAGAIELAALGVVLAVDNFGGRQTSLNSLAYLPIETLKIDRTLLARALDAPRSDRARGRHRARAPTRPPRGGLRRRVARGARARPRASLRRRAGPLPRSADACVGGGAAARDCCMTRYRLIDMAAGEIGIVTDERATISEGDSIALPDGTHVDVVEVYDDEFGREGDVAATLVVDDGSVPNEFL